jgi:hypothetical protein
MENSRRFIFGAMPYIAAHQQFQMSPLMPFFQMSGQRQPAQVGMIMVTQTIGSRSFCLGFLFHSQ